MNKNFSTKICFFLTMTSMASTQSIEALAHEWLRLDKNPETRAEIETLLSEGNTAELEMRLRNRIEFGTAGLRAEMKAGFSRMNQLTVIQASQGFAKYLLTMTPSTRTRGVVIGYDHRNNSEIFARLSAAVFLSLDIQVWFFRRLIHTPLVSYGIKKLKAAAGIMITASHNPKQDNGYKVYWENSCQIIPPHDTGIANSINQNLEPWIWDTELVDSHPRCVDPSEEVIESYYQELERQTFHKKDNEASDLKFVYTPLHGVGAPYARRAFETFGLKPFVEVEEQIKPDPDFPTVVFPNPEEGKGTLSLAMQTADKHGIKMILSNDPDADRFSFAEKQSDSQWMIFSGNQIGIILGAYILEEIKTARKPLNRIAMLASTVSSKMLARMAEVEGFRFEETLTGFKWLGNRAVELKQKEGLETVLAYEEAIGFSIGDIVKDKDGVTTLATFAELVVQLAKRNLTASGFLETLYKKYGYFITENSYFICYDQRIIKRIFEKIRYGENPLPRTDTASRHTVAYPQRIGTHSVFSVRDLTIGYDSSTTDKIPRLPVSSSSEMITFKLDNGCTFTLRTSGTEPKIKYYIEHSGLIKEQVEKELAEIVKAVDEELFEPEKNGLERKKVE